jgi:hypothetical protein
MKTVCAILLCAAFLCAPCLGKTKVRKKTPPKPSIEFRPYSKGGVFPEIYRDDFAETLKEYPRGRFARAYHGERASLHRYFLRAQNVFEDDADNDSMGYVILKLLFGCGDFRFSRALETEDFATRQAIGRLLDPLLTENHLHYPLTRSNYHFRRRAKPRETD